MDESKKINAGKYRNKQRYKNKTKVVHKNDEEPNVENQSDKLTLDDSNLFQNRSLQSNCSSISTYTTNVSLLNLSIATIPFYVRCGIEDKYFSENQLKHMREEAEETIIKYEQYIKTKEKKVSSKEDDQKKVPKKLYPEIDSIKITHENIESSESKELEQWLDDVLDA
ncbi:hypothetical protein Trydic_g9563 [Trypoxylus dichotomus]